MQTILKSRILKPAVILLLVLLLWLFLLLPIGQAGTSHQTIPTAPSTTSTNPTTTSSETPTTTPRITVTSIKPTFVLASQTPGSTTTPPVETIPSTVPSVTSVILSPTAGIQVTPISYPSPTLVVSSAIKLPASSGILYYLLCGVFFLIFVIGLVWLLRSRQRKSD